MVHRPTLSRHQKNLTWFAVGLMVVFGLPTPWYVAVTLGVLLAAFLELVVVTEKRGRS